MSCGYAFRRCNLSCSRSLTRRCRHSGRTSLRGHPFWPDDAPIIMAASTLAPMPMRRALPVPACGHRSNTCPTLWPHSSSPTRITKPCSSSLLAGVGAVRRLSCAQCLSSRHGRMTHACVATPAGSRAHARSLRADAKRPNDDPRILLMRRFLADLGSRLRASPFARNASWSVGLSLIERLIALLQTIVISRAVGITEYGVYGLLFSTVGLVSSAAGLQMGLPAVLYISRYRHTDKSKVAGVISVIQRFGWFACAGLVLLSVFYADEVGRILFDDPKYRAIVLLGACIAAASILSGLQDGIAQGFEIFKTLAKLKSATAALSLLLIVPAAELFGLKGVLAASLVGLLAKYIFLGRTVRGICRKEAIPPRGTGIRFLLLLTNIALPSVAVNILTGFTSWLGMVLVSKQVGGFDNVAIVNTGIQWRSPALLVAAALGSVAIPAFSRLLSTDDKNRFRRFRGLLIRSDLVIAIGTALPLVVLSSLVLRLYGPGFLVGRLPLSLILLSTVPTVLANVYLQELLGAARLWRQLALYIPCFGIQLVGFWLLVPRFAALRIGIALLAWS